LPDAPRLRQTLDLLLSGLSKQEIAREMNLSSHTVHDYIRAVYKHYGVATRARLMALWIRKP
jgi:DNA-binding NarL/FixJ family response regulator